MFLHANQMYWHHMSNYARAACDVMKAAYDLGQDGGKFRKAFGEVGIELCDIEDHVLGLRNGENYTNIEVAKDISPTFVFAVPGQFVTSVAVNASSAQGDVYIVLSNKTWGDEEVDVHVYAEGLGSVQFDVPDNSSMYISITLSTNSSTPLTNVTLMALFSRKEYFLLDDEGDEEEDEGNEQGDTEEDNNEEEGNENDSEREEEGGEDTKRSEGRGSDEIEKDEEHTGGVNRTYVSASGHVFNFFKSFIIMVFP